MFRLVRPFLFLLPPETAHNLIFSLLKLPPLRVLMKQRVADDPIELFGLRFKNRVGVAAGLDKNGQHLYALAAMGFGHIEVGSVTPKPQPGNQKPRIFRLKKDKALINRMGFPSRGADFVANQLQKRPEGVVIGVNIGKNRDTPLEEAERDYLTCVEKLFDVADYFTVNVSSPNTPGLRELQQRDHLDRILRTIQDYNREKPKPKAILLKVSPDLTPEAIQDIVDVAKANAIRGFVATNTTTSRDMLRTSAVKLGSIGDGGLSGPPLITKSLRTAGALGISRLPVIGCGGLGSSSDARQAVEAGASLIQTYTALVFHGPSVVRNLSEGMRGQEMQG
jgi:dihydroorotate dehydrogenase